jgi:hypothetical protein
MARETTFVVQPFRGEADGRLLPEDFMVATDAADACKRAKEIGGKFAGVVAYSQTRKQWFGTDGKLMILATHGRLPPNLVGLTLAFFARSSADK